MNRAKYFLASVLLLLAFAGISFAIPQNLTVQGKLQGWTWSRRGVIPSSPQDLNFQFTNATGTLLDPWSQTISTLLDAQGHFEVTLGWPATMLPLSVLANDNVYVQIRVGGETGEIVGRQKLYSVPFAYNTERLQGMEALNAGTFRRVLKTTTQGTIQLGSSTGFSLSNAIMASDSQYGIYGMGDLYGIYASGEVRGIFTRSTLVDRPALRCEGAGSLAPDMSFPYTSDKMKWGEALRLNSADLVIAKGTSTDLNSTIRLDKIAGKVRINATSGTYSSKRVDNSYVTSGSQILITVQNDVWHSVWVGYVTSGYFILYRSPPGPGSMDVAFLVIN
jgi:hypothetical protein